MSDATCKTCPNFVRWGGGVNDSGDCRAHPPVVVIDEVTHYVEDLYRYQYGQRYPTVDEREFCGEHPGRQPRELA